jgi:hypothetical protein
LCDEELLDDWDFSLAGQPGAGDLCKRSTVLDCCKCCVHTTDQWVLEVEDQTELISRCRCIGRELSEII